MTTLFVSNNYTLQPNDETILVDARTGSVTLSLLPLHVTGKRYEIKDAYGEATTHPISVVAYTGQFIDGLANFTFTIDKQSIIIHSDSANWFIL